MSDWAPMKASRIVDASHLAGDYKPKFKIFHNAPPDEVEAYCRANQTVFVLPVSSGSLDDAHDYSDLVKRSQAMVDGIWRVDYELAHLMLPLFIRKFDRDFIIEGDIKLWLGKDAEDVEGER